MKRKIVLASTSPRRIELFSKTGRDFEVYSPEYEEDMTLQMPPEELVKFLSLGKAQSIADKFDDALIIGSDTFIAYKNHVLGKPHTKERAEEMLAMLCGNEHSIFTGYAVVDTKTGHIENGAVESKICFKNFSKEEMNKYIENGDTLDRAGAYAIQNIPDTMLEKTEGDMDAIMGLPTKEVLQAIEKLENM